MLILNTSGSVEVQWTFNITVQATPYLIEVIVNFKALLFVGVHGAVTITSEPADAYVTEGDSAYFNCSYNGTRDVPIWTVNGIHYLDGSYPERHIYDSKSQVLEIYDTVLTDNGSTYQCTVFTKLSRIATLFVKQFDNTSTEGKPSFGT